MKKIAALLLALCLTLGACAALADGAIKISTIGPLTGDYAAYGKAVANALVLAVDEANAQGGIQFEVLEPQDDQGDGTLALNAYNKLMDDGMQILLGTVTSGACSSVAGSAVGERVFLLTPSASSDVVPAAGDNVFQICSSTRYWPRRTSERKSASSTTTRRITPWVSPSPSGTKRANWELKS